MAKTVKELEAKIETIDKELVAKIDELVIRANADHDLLRAAQTQAAENAENITGLSRANEGIRQSIHDLTKSMDEQLAAERYESDGFATEIRTKLQTIEDAIVAGVFRFGSPEPTLSVRYRFNRTTTTKGVESWDSTAETQGHPLDVALNLSDQVVAAMRARHPHLPVQADPYALPDPGIDPSWEGTMPAGVGSRPLQSGVDPEYEAAVDATRDADPDHRLEPQPASPEVDVDPNMAAAEADHQPVTYELPDTGGEVAAAIERRKAEGREEELNRAEDFKNWPDGAAAFPEVKEGEQSIVCGDEFEEEHAF